MNFGKEKLDLIENLAMLQFSIPEIAASCGMRENLLKKLILNKNSQPYYAYERGRIQAEADVRKSILDMAKQGSTPAQKQFIELIQTNKDRLNDLAISDSKSIKEKAEAKLKELEYKKSKGELVEKKKVIEMTTSIIIAAKMKLLSIPTKTAPKLIGIKEINRIKDILKSDIYEALEELSRLKSV